MYRSNFRSISMKSFDLVLLTLLNTYKKKTAIVAIAIVDAGRYESMD